MEAGHEVTCVARGVAGSPIDGVRLVRADRDNPDAYDEVAAQRWDCVFDVARHPGHVRSAVRALAPVTDRWAFVSTGNVYRSHATVGDDETSALLDPLQTDSMPSMEQYGEAKVACEQAVLEALGDRALVARAGLIGGPGDESGRSGYWPWRFAHPSSASGDVLIPASTIATSLIDVRDLARWLVDFGEGGNAPGIYDAIANRSTLPEFLAEARNVAGHVGQAVSATDDWLIAQGVAEWMGPRSLPLWLADPEWLGFAARQGHKILANGLKPRPLAETLADVLAWEESRTIVGLRGAGLSDEDEGELLGKLQVGQPSSATSRRMILRT